LAARIKPALFLHVWNSTLVHRGVDKVYRPPKGSLLRMFTDRHPVDGWVGEYDAQSLDRALELKEQLNTSTEEKAQLQLASERLQAELSGLQAALERSQMQVKATLASTSWRLTAPLRAAATFSARCNPSAEGNDAAGRELRSPAVGLASPCFIPLFPAPHRRRTSPIISRRSGTRQRPAERSKRHVRSSPGDAWVRR
jgi:hypothetical protein